MFERFRNLNISTKIALICVVALLFVVMTGLLGLSNTKNMVEGIRESKSHFDATEKILQADRDCYQALTAIQALLQVEPDSAAFRNYEGEFAENIQQARERVAIAAKNATTSKEKESIAVFNEEFDSWVQTGEQIVSLARDGTPESRAQAINLSFTTSEEQFASARGCLDEFTDSMVEKMDSHITDAVADYNSQKRNTLLILLLTILVTVCIGFLLWRSIMIPFKEVIAHQSKVAGGDLSQLLEVKWKNEIGTLGEATNKTVLSLRELIQKMIDAAQQLAASTQQFSAATEQSAQIVDQAAQATQQLVLGADQQKNDVKQAMVQMEESSAAVEEIAATIQEVAGTAGRTQQYAVSGERKLDKGAAEMQEIMAATQQVAKLINELGIRSQTIGKIVDMISGIAGQTNLLALNAAIEAARAGEQGRGFAVVAAEVSDLAEQSSNAAEDIAKLVEEIQNETSQAVQAMERTNQVVEKGTVVITTSRETFLEIKNAVDAMSIQMQELAKAADQIASSVEAVVNKANQLDQSTDKMAEDTQSIAAGVEEELATIEQIASSAESLAKMADELQSVTTSFKL